LHEPYFYTMTDYDGMRDEGHHEFDFAISAYPDNFANNSAVIDAESYQQELSVIPGKVQLPEMPSIASENVRLSALKWAEKGDAIILRLVEYRGATGEVVVSLPAYVRSVEQVNLLEREGCWVTGEKGKTSIMMKPWEITTLKLWLTE